MLTDEEIKNGWYYPGVIEQLWDYACWHVYHKVAAIRGLFVAIPVIYRHVLIWGDRYGGEMDRRVAVRMLEVARKKKSAQLRMLSMELMRDYLHNSE